jgi:uncharacterized membrane protein
VIFQGDNVSCSNGMAKSSEKILGKALSNILWQFLSLTGFFCQKFEEWPFLNMKIFLGIGHITQKFGYFLLILLM